MVEKPSYWLEKGSKLGTGLEYFTVYEQNKCAARGRLVAWQRDYCNLGWMMISACKYFRAVLISVR